MSGVGVWRARWAAPAAIASALLAVGLTGVDALAYNCDDSGTSATVVDSITPSGDAVSPYARIVVTFDQPMSESSVSFSIQPDVRGVLSWTDSQTLSFRPMHLTRGVSYEVRVSGLAAAGRVIRRARTSTFTTDPAPQLTIKPGPSSIRVPILMYHYVRVNPYSWDRMGYALSVPPAVFGAQMDWLTANGYHTVTMTNLLGFLQHKNGLPSKPIVLTFDDGYADFYNTALPVLLGHDFTAVSYVVSGFINRPGYMTGAQIVAAQGDGIEIGSHTVSHANLTTETDTGLAYELTASKAALQTLLGQPVVSFCYPSGRFGAREAAAVAAAGYQDATTTMGGSWHSLDDRFIWTRVRISGGESLAEFAAAVNTY